MPHHLSHEHFTLLDTPYSVKLRFRAIALLCWSPSCKDAHS